MTKLLRNIIMGAAVLALPLVAVALPAGASTSQDSKFIRAIHAWVPVTKQHTDRSEISEGEAICHNIRAVASNQVTGINGENDAAVGWPRGTTAVTSAWSALTNESGQLFISTVNQGLPAQAAYTVDADLLGISVLDLCPNFEHAAKYINQHGLMGGAGMLPTTNKVPQWASSSGTGTKGYGYSATEPPPTTTTTTVPSPPGTVSCTYSDGTLMESQSDPACIGIPTDSDPPNLTGTYLFHDNGTPVGGSACVAIPNTNSCEPGTGEVPNG